MRSTKEQIFRDVEGVKWSKKVANNTYRYVCARGFERIRLHQTDIITFYNAQKRFVLISTGGYRTPTTKSRINQFVNEGLNNYYHAYIFQKDYLWYVRLTAPTHRLGASLLDDCCNGGALLDLMHGDIIRVRDDHHALEVMKIS